MLQLDLSLPATLRQSIAQKLPGQAAQRKFSHPQSYGRHFGPWTPVALRPLVEERSLLRRAVDRGEFAPGGADAAYDDRPQPIGFRATISAPLVPLSSRCTSRGFSSRPNRSASASPST